MSASKSFLRRARQAARPRRRASPRAPRATAGRWRRYLRPSPKGMSAATSSNSHCAGRPRQNGARAVEHRAIECGIGRLQINVATRDMNSRGHDNNAVLIAGPTASGKSALALALARKTGGVVINADSMQVYRELRVLTARPSPEEETEVPHHLYGHVDAAVEFFRRRMGRGRGSAPEARAEKRVADLRRWLRTLFQGADARAFRRAANSGRNPRGRACEARA